MEELTKKETFKSEEQQDEVVETVAENTPPKQLDENLDDIKKNESTDFLSKKKKEKKNILKIKKKKKEPEKIEKPRLKRVKADPNVGLTVEQVVERFNKGYINKTEQNNSKTYLSIFLDNILTFFNILCLGVAVCLIIAGSFKNLFFLVIMLANTSVGIIQEIRAKKTIDKLSLLTAPTTKVVRGGTEYEVTTEEVVIDDIAIYSNGKQIVADCILIDGAVEVNEALLTGESVPIKKNKGDLLLAGSFISSGNCRARVDKIGADCYIEELSRKAKTYKKPKSELFNSLNAIIKIIGIIIIPIAVLMYLNNYSFYHSYSEAVAKTAGAVIGMIPSGMFLLCSIALTVSVIRLAQKHALVQDLYCVEMLARVNVLCLDKTGTITDGTMKVFNCVEVQNKSNLTLKRIMGSFLSSLNDNNQTSQSLINYFGFNKELKAIEKIPFSSSRKLSAVTFEDYGTYILGAPEFVLPNLKEGKHKDMIEQYAKDGYRVLVLANSTSPISKGNLPTNRSLVAIIILEDHIRDDAIETIQWFKNNDVKIKIISGDNPLTVAEIAKRVGVDDTENFINLEGMSESQVINAANKYTVFGRVTPEQKAILVKAMKSQGNTIAMTGDGVNDILALKEADCAIAMASGSDAVRNVSHMVLLDSKFSSMPEAVFEGRRVINNVQKSSALFFMKTIFTILFSIIVLALGQAYPFAPLQLYMLEFFVIGIPSFFLALKPNKERVKGKFMANLFKSALPGALTLLLNVMAVYGFVLLTQKSLDDVVLISSMCTIVLTFTGIAMLNKLCQPYTVTTGILFTAMLGITAALTIFLPDFFEISSVGLTNMLFVFILILISNYLIKLFDYAFSKITFTPQAKTTPWIDKQLNQK